MDRPTYALPFRARVPARQRLSRIALVALFCSCVARAHAQSHDRSEFPAFHGAAQPDGGTLTLCDAVRSALRRHPAIALSGAAIAVREAEAREARAAFDPTIHAAFSHRHDAQHLLPAERFAAAERTLVTDRTALALGASAGFQWGMQVSPRLTLERVAGSRNPNPLSLPEAPVQRARAELILMQPLLRGRGETGAASELHTAERTRDAAVDAAAHEAQARVLDVMVAYYSWTGADQAVAALRASVARADQRLAQTQRLVDAGQRTRADLGQVKASLENQTSSLYAAQADCERARFELALAMGLDGQEPPQWFPADALPDDSARAMPPVVAVQRALAARRDLRASDRVLAAASIAVTGAERNALPALDLDVSVGYEGTLDRDGVGPFLGSVASHVPGINAGATLTLELPIHNDAAGARLEQRRANRRHALTQRADVVRRTRSGVLGALTEGRLAAEAMAASQRAHTVSLQLVGDERDKLRQGLASVMDVVLTEERLTETQLSSTASQLRHAVARARLQFELGALPELEGDVPAPERAARGGARPARPRLLGRWCAGAEWLLQTGVTPMRRRGSNR